MSKIYVDEIAGIASADTVAIPGHVIQVVSTVSTTRTDTTNTSFVDLSGLSLTITPCSTSSKILILFSVQCFVTVANSSSPVKLVRGTTDLETFDYPFYGSSGSSMGIASYTYLDSPNSTLATTYKLQGRSRDGNQVRFTYDDSNGDSKSTITLMEIAG